ncbi:hypothetical protein [Streptomyces sp. NPDC002067]
MWAYCFNFDEAVRCFERAIAEDPECAMAHWGVAFAKGPNYNKAWRFFDADDLKASVEYARISLAQARAASASCTPFERGLITALAARFPDQGVRRGRRSSTPSTVRTRKPCAWSTERTPMTWTRPRSSPTRCCVSARGHCGTWTAASRSATAPWRPARSSRPPSRCPAVTSTRPSTTSTSI